MDWGQLRTILWLRWHLSRNQWARGGKLNAALTMIAVALGFLIGAAGGLGGVLAGTLALSKASPLVMLVVWDLIVVAFLFFWMIGVVSELQRSETIDIGRMLHLPVSLGDIFLVNYVASHLTLSIILFLPWTLGLCVGLSLGKGGFMIGLLPLVLGFVFMITAWTYCLRGWIVTLMVNKRRRRTIIAGITFGFILLSQLPYLIGNLQHDRRRHGSETTQSAPTEQQTTTRPNGLDRKTLPHIVLLAHYFVPFLWVGNGAMSLARGDVWPAVLAAAGAFGIGGLGLRRAYRSTLRFYRGQARRPSGGRVASSSAAWGWLFAGGPCPKAAPLSLPPAAKTATAVRPGLFDRTLPGVPDEATAAALAFFRSLIRAPEVKMMLATNLLMLLIFGAMVLLRRSAGIAEPLKPFVTAGAIVFTFLGMSQLMFNQFGFDRGGFRRLVLLPAPRKWILLGKNLAFAPLALGMGIIILVLAALALHVSLIVFLAAALQLAAAFLIVSMVGNLLSTLVPHHVAAGSLRRTKTSATTTLLIFVSRLLFPSAMIPLLIPPVLGLLFSRVGWLPAAPVNLLFSAVLFGLLVLLYGVSLAPLGELLQQREQKILQVVTEEVE